ncbi:cytochrome c [Spirosoma spitsbergense]|uniref:cytochrome c n=1 Tax=Spirosoma spitsbergense TaxID=431554 RepID=UPI00037292ED|nr:c-type cytochrome [Spirosoma spitsbergense]
MNRFLTILKWTGISLVALILVILAVVYGISEYKLTRTYNDVPLVAVAVPHDTASIAEGKRLVGVYHCGSCHGERYEGKEFLNVPNVARIVSANLTTKIPAYSDAELARLVRHAIKRDGHNAWMFASGMYTPMTDVDMGKMISYLRTLKPVPTSDTLGENSFGPIGRGIIVAGQFPIMAEAIDHQHIPDYGQDTTLVGRGKYLTMTVCSGCHGGPELKGSNDHGMNAPALIIATAYKPEAFRHFLQTGEGGLSKKDCGAMSVMCREYFHNLTDRESDAIYAYLQTLPTQKTVASQ